MFVLALAFRVQRQPLLAGRWKLQMRQKLINDAFIWLETVLAAVYVQWEPGIRCCIYIDAFIASSVCCNPHSALLRCTYALSDPLLSYPVQTHVSSVTAYICSPRLPVFLCPPPHQQDLRPIPPTIPPSHRVLLTHPPPQALPLIVCEIWRPDGRWGISPFDLWERGGVDGGYPFLLLRFLSAWWIFPANSYYSFGLVPLISLCSVAMFWMCEITKIPK